MKNSSVLVACSCIAVILCFWVTSCAQPEIRNAQLKAYPDVPAMGIDSDWFGNAQPSPADIKFMKWINGPGMTNAQFQRWLVDKVFRDRDRSPLSTQYAEWLNGPGKTNLHFQQWLNTESLGEKTK